MRHQGSRDESSRMHLLTRSQKTDDQPAVRRPRGCLLIGAPTTWPTADSEQMQQSMREPARPAPQVTAAELWSGRPPIPDIRSWLRSFSELTLKSPATSRGSRSAETNAPKRENLGDVGPAQPMVLKAWNAMTAFR